MANPAGSFIWYELMADNADGAAAFYGAVVGWRFGGSDPQSPVDYRMILRDDGSAAGGMLPLSAEMRAQGAHPAWVPYIFVPDVDAAKAAILADGGRALGPRMDIAPGSFAMVTDPFGTPFYLMTPIPPASQPDATSSAFAPDRMQAVCWNELASPDPAGAKAFYAKHFGHAFNHAMPMGPQGDYAFLEHHGQTLGAIMPMLDPARPPLWVPYFSVPAAGAAKDAIAAGGGTVLSGPHQVPGGSWVVLARDPQGALFGVSAREQ